MTLATSPINIYGNPVNVVHGPKATAGITLTANQQTALDKIWDFILDPDAKVFALSGYAGCGKTTLVRTILDRLPGFLKLSRAIAPDLPQYDTALTATTNKAAEAMQDLAKQECATIHSVLGLRVHTDSFTYEKKLVMGRRPNVYLNNPVIYVVDEASFIDHTLLEHILNGLVPKGSKNKVIFIGDPGQLSPVKSKGTPVFFSGFQGAHLSEVVRQAKGNQIIDLSTMFRKTVETGEFFSFKPDGVAVKHLTDAEFEQEVFNEFGRGDWSYNDSKVLAWTNERVVKYNNVIHTVASSHGLSGFKPLDYAIVNEYFQVPQLNVRFRANELVQIEHMYPSESTGLPGFTYVIKGIKAFMPNSLRDKKIRITQARNEDDYETLDEIADWIDLRHAYACTVNKSQGSTYKRVFIDLEDICRCNSGDQIARMLYVAVSRASHQVLFRGDFV